MARRRLGISISGNSVRDKIALAQRAEAAGFEMVFTNDDPGQDTFVALAAIAAHTSTIRIGSGICRAFIRNPVVTASAAQDVDELSNGRMILGLATGTKRQNLYQYGVQVDKPASQLREAIAIMRAVWRNAVVGQPITFEGQYYRIQQPRYHDPFAPRDSIPIYIGAVNARMMQLAGELCDGMAGHPCYTARYLAEVVWPNTAIGLAKAGRDRSSFVMARWITTIIDDDDPERAKVEAKTAMGNYLATRSYGTLLDFHGWSAEKAAIQDAFFRQKDMTAVANAVTDEIVNAMTIYGRRRDAIAQLERHWPTCDIPILIPSGGWRLPANARFERARRVIDTFAPLID
ncbi:MAG: LLM class flavin-dependent oxidoreductase [Dehalococcoidia bacterium]|nr:LLM class flavin-dependent oxidoreductase [Dehalococcoidia bacterium]